MAKSKKQSELEQRVDELTNDLQRIRADFENYRKRVEQEKEMARASGKVGAIMKLLPVIDNIERAISHTPDDLKENTWAQGVSKLVKNLEKSLTDMGVSRIKAEKGTHFNPDLHEAIQFDEDADGDHEVIAEELQAGYMLGSDVMRPSMVKVTRQ
jgi:molecular chaperone GrpE